MCIISPQILPHHSRNGAGLEQAVLLLQAHKMSPSDPLACNELGVLASRKGHHANATHWFLRALDLVPGKLTAGRVAVVISAEPMLSGCMGVGGETNEPVLLSLERLRIGHLLTLP